MLYRITATALSHEHADTIRTVLQDLEFYEVQVVNDVKQSVIGYKESDGRKDWEKRQEYAEAIYDKATPMIVYHEVFELVEKDQTALPKQ